VTTTSASTSSSSTGWWASLRRSLDRPLTSYQLTIGITGLLVGLGLVMVLSASSVLSYATYGSSYFIFSKQAMWVAIGVPLAWLVSRTPVKVFRWMAYPALLGSLALIGLTYVPGFGVDVNGNRNWLSFGGPISIQPSEVAKLAMIVWVADLYARKERLLDDWKHLLVPMLPVTLLVAGMVVLQGDLGTALVFFAIIGGMMWIVGAPSRVLLFLAAALGSLLAFFATMEPERVKRLATFTDPLATYGDDGWQAAHGLFALASGSFWGVGLGGSRQKWGTLPEAHTDFIFAVIGEELGLFGTLVVLVLFLLLAYTGLRIAMRTREPFVRYAAAGITVWLLAQALINLGMVLGLLPVIGVPLPLVSYGGSALLPTLVALGMLCAFAKTEPGARAALDSRRRSRNRSRSGRQPTES
jgi:cell division protein FtsW